MGVGQHLGESLELRIVAEDGSFSFDFRHWQETLLGGELDAPLGAERGLVQELPCKLVVLAALEQHQAVGHTISGLSRPGRNRGDAVVELRRLGLDLTSEPGPSEDHSDAALLEQSLDVLSVVACRVGLREALIDHVAIELQTGDRGWASNS